GLLVVDVGPETENTRRVIRLPEAVEEGPLLASELQNVRSSDPRKSRRVSVQRMRKMRVDAALIEEVTVNGVKINRRHPRQSVIDHVTRKPSFSEVRIAGNSGRNRQVQSEAAIVHDVRGNGPGIVHDRIVDIGLVCVGVIDKSGLRRTHVMQSAVAK